MLFHEKAVKPVAIHTTDEVTACCDDMSFVFNDWKQSWISH